MRMHPLLHPLFIKFIEHFNGDRDYFECHEVLEDYWKEVEPGNKEHPLTAWIQLATGLYHWRRANYSGALKILKKALEKMKADPDSLYFRGIDLSELIANIELSLAAIEDRRPFTPFRLRITDESITDQIHPSSLQENYEKPDTDWLIHKHMRRDRTHILQERQEKLIEKKRNRSK